MMRPPLACLLLPIVATMAAAQALPEPRSATVPRIDAVVNIDGVLDEAPWQKAPRLTPFVIHDTMAAGRVNTSVRVWYDAQAVYLGWSCEDPDIQATFTQRDRRFWEEEVVEFFVTAGRLDRYFELQWNTLGGTFDAIIANDIGADGRSRGIKEDWSFTAPNMTYAVKVDGTERRGLARELLPLQSRPEEPGRAAQLVADDLVRVPSAHQVRLPAVRVITAS